MVNAVLNFLWGALYPRLSLALCPYDCPRCFVGLEAVWILADIVNALMALPNLIALLALSPIVISETKKYFDKHRKN